MYLTRQEGRRLNKNKSRDDNDTVAYLGQMPSMPRIFRQKGVRFYADKKAFVRKYTRIVTKQ